MNPAKPWSLYELAYVPGVHAKAWDLTIEYLLAAPHPRDQALVARYFAGDANSNDLQTIADLAAFLFRDWRFTGATPLPTPLPSP